MKSLTVFGPETHLSNCENEACGSAFDYGQEIWKKGRHKFCSLKCMLESPLWVLEEGKAFVPLDGQEMIMIENSLRNEAKSHNGLAADMHTAAAMKFKKAKEKFHDSAKDAFKNKYPSLRIIGD